MDACNESLLFFSSLSKKWHSTAVFHLHPLIVFKYFGTRDCLCSWTSVLFKIPQTSHSLWLPVDNLPPLVSGILWMPSDLSLQMTSLNCSNLFQAQTPSFFIDAPTVLTLLFPRCPYQELVDSGSWVADNMFTDSDPVYPGLCWLGPVYCVWQTWFRVGANLDCHPLSSPLAD